MLKKATTKVTETGGSSKLNYIDIYFHAYEEDKFVTIEEIHSGHGDTTKITYSISRDKVPENVFSDIKSGKYNYTMQTIE